MYSIAFGRDHESTTERVSECAHVSRLRKGAGMSKTIVMECVRGMRRQRALGARCADGACPFEFKRMNTYPEPTQSS